MENQISKGKKGPVEFWDPRACLSSHLYEIFSFSASYAEFQILSNLFKQNQDQLSSEFEVLLLG